MREAEIGQFSESRRCRREEMMEDELTSRNHGPQAGSRGLVDDRISSAQDKKDAVSYYSSGDCGKGRTNLRELDDGPVGSDSLGRLLVVVDKLVVRSWTCHLLLRPVGGVLFGTLALGRHQRRGEGGW